LAIKPTNAKDPEDYLAQIDEPRRKDIEALDALIREGVAQNELRSLVREAASLCG